MTDPEWYEALPRWAREWIDQMGHALIGGLPSALFGGLATLGLPAWWAGCIGAVAGSAAMTIYELVQNVGDKSNDYVDMTIDLAVGIGTACLVGAIIWAVA